MTRVNVHDTLDTSVMMIGFNWIVRENANSAGVSMPWLNRQIVYALRACCSLQGDWVPPQQTWRKKRAKNFVNSSSSWPEVSENTGRI